MYTVRIFMKYACTFARLKQLIYSIKSDLPLADEIAEPRPDMTIKVAAFTVSEKSSNIIDKKNSVPEVIKLLSC